MCEKWFMKSKFLAAVKRTWTLGWDSSKFFQPWYLVLKTRQEGQNGMACAKHRSPNQDLTTVLALSKVES